MTEYTPRTKTTPPILPVADLERDGSMDTLRGVAVLGILAMNIVAFALPSAAYTATHNPAVNQFAGEFTASNAIAWWVNHLLFDQKMMSIFSMLFGAGVVMQDQRQARKIGEPHASFAGTYYRRLGILLLLGMIHAYAVWFGDILVAYAICGVFLYPMRTVRPSRLIAIGLIVFCVAILINTGLGAMITYLQRAGEEARTLLDAGQSITDEQKRILEAWDHTRPNVIPGEGKILAEVAARRGTWLESFNTNAELTMFFQTMLFLIWTLWRALGCMLIGMGLAKLGFFAARCTPRTYATLAFVGYLVGLPLIGFGATRVIANHADAGYAFGVGAQYNYVGSLFVALAHASLVMLICQLGLFKGAMFALAAVGRMAFTNYLMQSIICTFIFFGFGLGFFGKFERGEAYLFVLGVWALQLLWSPLWLEHCRFGPFEWAWRSLTYMNLQPLRRERPRPAA